VVDAARLGGDSVVEQRVLVKPFVICSWTRRGASCQTFNRTNNRIDFLMQNHLFLGSSGFHTAVDRLVERKTTSA